MNGLQETDTKQKWYKVSEAAKEFGLTSRTINQQIRNGTIKCTKISGSGPTGFVNLVSESEMQKYMASRRERKVRDPETGDMSIDDIAEILQKMIKNAHDAGYKEGIAEAKSKFKEMLKEVK